MDFLALGALFFLVVVAFSVGLEIQDRYHEIKDSENGFRLLPRRNYYELHGQNYQPQHLAPAVEQPGTFLVKREDRPARCEICHQNDMFDLGGGFCFRCNHKTS